MIDLWRLALTAWPGALPEHQPLGVYVDKVRLDRHGTLEPKPGALVLVLSGHLSEWMQPAINRDCIVGQYGPRDIVAMPVGRLAADKKTDVLVFDQGWEAHLPEAHALVRMLREAEAVDLKRRLSQAMCLTITERVRRHVEDNAIDIDLANRQHLAAVLGGSREMVSRVLKDMASEPRA